MPDGGVCMEVHMQEGAGGSGGGWREVGGVPRMERRGAGERQC